jgi:hypothetical protein
LQCMLPCCAVTTREDKRHCRGLLYILGIFSAIRLIVQHYRDQIAERLPGIVLPSRQVAKLGLFTPKVEESKYQELITLVSPPPLTEDGQGGSDVSMTCDCGTPHICLGAGLH